MVDAPEIFEAQTQWIVDNLVTENIKLVLHEGDFVENGSSNASEWENGMGALAILGNSLPHLIAIGNHDYDNGISGGDRTTTAFNSYLPQSYYTGKGWWSGGFYDGTSTYNSYYLATIEGKNYIILNFEFYPRAAVVAWADALLTTHANRDAIIVTHAYLYDDSSRVRDMEPYNYRPFDYGLSADSSGEVLWNTLIEKHSNIIWVQGGHFIEDGLGYLRSERSTTTVHQVLANYQEPIPERTPQETKGGHLRIMTIKPSTAKISVRTYSPYINQWLTDAANQFTVDYQNTI